MRRLGFLAAVALALAACAIIRPTPGDSCTTGQEACQTDGGVLVCQHGHYVTSHCGGPAGCHLDTNRTVECDQSAGAAPGEACLPLYAGKTECSGKDYVACMEGTWMPQSCSGGTSCQASDGGIFCR